MYQLFQQEDKHSVLWCVFSHFSFAKEGVNKAPRNKLSESLYGLQSLNINLTHEHGRSPFVHMVQVNFAFIFIWIGCLNLMYLAQGVFS